MVVDYNKILTQNPSKNLRISYEKMKSDYNTNKQTLWGIESAATDYKALYENMPLPFLLENSRYIFAEPRLGYQFYMEHVVNNPNAIMIAEYKTERNKVEDFIQEFGRKMGDVQKKMYNDLYSVLVEKTNSVRNINTILEHAFSKDVNAKSEYRKIADSVYSQNADEIIHAFECAENKDVYYALLPFASSDFCSVNPSKFLTESVIDDTTNKPNMDAWKTFVESIVIISKLYQDKVYVEAVNNLPFYVKTFLNGFATESLSKQLDELSVVHVVESGENVDTFNEKSFDCFYSTPQNAVNRIFQDDEIYHYEKAENDAIKQERARMDEVAKDVLLEYVSSEYYNSSDTSSPITGYNYFDDNISLESAFMILSEDVSGNPNKVVAAHSTSMREEDKKKKSSNDRNNNTNDDDEDDDGDSNDSNKSTSQYNYQPNAPKPKNIANAVQFKAMDAEAKQMKKMSNLKQSVGEVKNAVKAVAALPANILNSIKDVAKQWDEADEDRRKKYMIEPGFRKRSLKNLKLAILYGGAAQANLALVPVIAIARHYSKDKDKRIRNELAHELDTEIKVTEEKISDASANGDQQQKYKLMRIKASLEKEAMRVKTNSKYV
jgi:hypothetical protein